MKIASKTWLGLGLAAVMAINTAQAETTVTGAGATFPAPLYSKWFDVYRAKGVTINYQAIGSGGGIQQLKANTVDFGASDAPLSNKDLEDIPYPVVQIPTVAGAIAMVYHLEGVSGLRLDGATIAGIFLGEITRWNDPRIKALNPTVNLPDTAIAVAHRSDGSGTTYIYTHYLSAVSSTWADKVGAGKSVDWPVGLGGKGNDGVAAIVRQTPGGFGYVELAYAKKNGLAYAAVRNKSGRFVLPSVAGTVAAAKASSNALMNDLRAPIVNASGKSVYPICGFTYILIYRQQAPTPARTAVIGFLKWANSAGQQYADDLLYAPLPSSIQKINASKLSQLK